jgi:hypothetical protein
MFGRVVIAMIPFVRGHRRKDSEAMTTAFSSSFVAGAKVRTATAIKNVAAPKPLVWSGHLLPTGAANKLRRRD